MGALGPARLIWRMQPRVRNTAPRSHNPTTEVLGILRAVGTDDPLLDFTEGLFLNVGTRSREVSPWLRAR